ncbi:hypothetical protein B7939_00540 [Eggerthia catenaformis]|nr:hypothetical protein B7939_00540 [Eggerthia catenaformis]
MTKKERIRKLIRESIINELEKQNKTTKYHLDLAEDYMKYYDMKEKLFDDIKENGPRITTAGTGGAEITKDNKSYNLITKTTDTMLKILKSLNIENNIVEMSDEDAYM